MENMNGNHAKAPAVLFTMFSNPYIAMATVDILTKIGEKIRARRLEKKLTIQQVADNTNLTKGLLSRIENSRTMPSLPVFVQILQALDISISDFFNELCDDKQSTWWIFRKSRYGSSENNEATDCDYHYILSKVIPAANVEFNLLTIKPGGKRQVESKYGERFSYIIAGDCEYQFNNEVVSIQEGDSIYVINSTSHAVVNKCDHNVVILEIDFLFIDRPIENIHSLSHSLSQNIAGVPG